MASESAEQQQTSTSVPRRALAVLGFGKLASSIVRGSMTTGFLKADEIVVWARSDARMAQARALGLRLVDMESCARSADALLLSIKPQFFGQLAPRLSVAKKTTVISVMAGWTIQHIAARLNVDHVIRAMPNVAARAQAAVTALSMADNCPAEARQFASRLFASVGRVEQIHESHLDAVTAISSSGIAYQCLFTEALIRAAIQLGLPADVAKKLPLDVLHGVERSTANGEVDLSALRASVTSPNGTTAAALAVLEEGAFTQLISRAARAAADRAVELGKANT